MFLLLKLTFTVCKKKKKNVLQPSFEDKEKARRKEMAIERLVENEHFTYIENNWRFFNYQVLWVSISSVRFISELWLMGKKVQVGKCRRCESKTHILYLTLN